MSEFSEYVDEWDKLVAELEKVKKQTEPIRKKEMEMRRAIAASVQAALGPAFKEGTNTYTLEDGRQLKINHKLKREVEPSMLGAVREKYGQLNDVPCTLDELLRVKYEIDKRNFNKLSDAAALVFSELYSTKPEAPEVKLS